MACSGRPSTPPALLISSIASRTPSRMLTPIEEDPPVKGPATPILIGSAAWAAADRQTEAAATAAYNANLFKRNGMLSPVVVMKMLGRAVYPHRPGVPAGSSLIREITYAGAPQSGTSAPCNGMGLDRVSGKRRRAGR